MADPLSIMVDPLSIMVDPWSIMVDHGATKVRPDVKKKIASGAAPSAALVLANPGAGAEAGAGAGADADALQELAGVRSFQLMDNEFEKLKTLCIDNEVVLKKLTAFREIALYAAVVDSVKEIDI